MKLKKLIPVLLFVFASVSLVGALLIFILAAPKANATYKRVLEIIIGGLMVLLSALIYYYLWLIRDAEPNFFLFDRARKRNIPVENLTFAIINDRMNFFLTLISDSPEDLWQKNALERDIKLGPRRVYRPLLAYKMLYDLADKNVESYWNLLLTAPEDTLESLYGALKQGGEQEMEKALRFVINNYRQAPDKIKDFICGNQRYICKRMKSYICKNIELFY